QRRLTHARLTADEDQRRRDDAAAEHSVELGDSARDALLLVRTDVGEAADGARRARTRLAVAPCQLLDERSEGTAPRAAAEPASGGGAALGTRKLDDNLGHAGKPSERIGRYVGSIDNCAYG